jgi:hypothetical protein
MITIETKIGDVVTDWYGQTKRVVAATRGGHWWLVENVATGQTSMARRITADTVVIVGQPIEGGN